jgi:hypothetical protein
MDSGATEARALRGDQARINAEVVGICDALEEIRAEGSAPKARLCINLH